VQYIKDDLIRKLYRINISKLALITFLDLVNFANEKGRVEIYYKDMVRVIGCSQAQFYNVLIDLEDLGLIRRGKNSLFKKEIVVDITGNDFTSGYKNYVNTNSDFFYKRFYKDLKSGEIRTYLYILFRVSKQKARVSNNDSNKLYYNDSIETVSNRLNMKVRMVRYYLKKLDEMGYICIGEKIDINKKDYDIITLNKESTKTPTDQYTEKGQVEENEVLPLFSHWCHYIQTLCRRYGKNFDLLNLKDTAILLNQYRKSAEEHGKDIYNVISNAFNNLKDDILDSRSIHYIVRSLIGIDYSESIIIY